MSEIPTRAELADTASDAIRAFNHATVFPVIKRGRMPTGWWAGCRR